MTTINTYNLELLLQKRIEASTGPEELLPLFKVAQYLKNTNVVNVSTINDLPALTEGEGKLFFVASEGKLYFNYQNSQWVVLGETASPPISTGGTLWVWGYNSDGQLGDGTTDNISSPLQIVTGSSDWAIVSAGGDFSAAIKTDGTMWTWGANGYGQLGDGTIDYRSSPGTTIDGGTNWSKVGAGYGSLAGIKTDGTLWTWGRNNSGELGDGTLDARSSPGSVAGGGTNWDQVSVGAQFMGAVKTDGTLWTWGLNQSGQLGDGNTDPRSSPSTVAGGGTNWKQVSAGDNFAAAVKTDGTLWTWGTNGYGRLGDGGVNPKSSPETTAGGGTDWSQVSCGDEQAGAIKTDGTLWTWGLNDTGQLGDGTTENRSSPATVAGGGTTWSYVSMANWPQAALKTDGTLWLWGEGGDGGIGNNSLDNQSSPVTTAAGGTNWSQVSARAYHVLAIQVAG